MSELEALSATFEALVERIVERKLQERLALVNVGAVAPARVARPMKVPEAARETGIGEGAIRASIASGLIPRRLVNPNAKGRPTYLVTIDEVLAAAEGRSAHAATAAHVERAAPEPINMEARARELRARPTRRGP